MGTITLVRFGAVIAGSAGGAVIVAGVNAITSLWLATGVGSGNAGRLLAATGGVTAAVAGVAIVAGAVSVGADGVTMGCVAARRICKSFAVRRRSFHGKFRPGIPNDWPPITTLNSSA
ncbi:hypothetical protein CR105_00180 [Massilia eurypsychrophila]|uniref:Uncharacterized protein n=1 Tax=Massilia eurypsychrophila TaxID=1485217 RepID=A0A2G8TKQ6_9BURK|nr:hypothetical protein CR105_00180 [Massilia eurypsychrophila]